MKEKKIKEINPLEGLFATFGVMRSVTMGESRLGRDDVFREEFENIVVDTCIAFDTGTWETGISQDNEDSWTIVEQYSDKNEAEIGHAKWAELMKENPNRDLKDINVWGI